MQQPQQQQQNQGLLLQGRIVWTSGKLFEGKPDTDDNGKPILDDNGQQTFTYGFGLAVPKIDPRTGQNSEQFVNWWNAMYREAYTIFPNGQFPADFAWKYKDGDTNDHNGKPFADREGYKGCVVIACTTKIPIKYFKWEGNTNVLIADGIKCGDYVNVQLNMKAHPAKGRGKAGMYMNPTACQLIAPGKEIINMPSGDQMFGMAAPQYMVGNIEAPTTPVMPQGNMPAGPAMPGMPMNGGQQYAQPAPAQQQYHQPAPTHVDPHYGVIPQGHQPAPAQNMPAPGQQYNMPNPGQQQYAQPAPGGMPVPGQQQYAPQQGGPAMPQMPGVPR